jgi:hypothetical protein
MLLPPPSLDENDSGRPSSDEEASTPRRKQPENVLPEPEPEPEPTTPDLTARRSSFASLRFSKSITRVITLIRPTTKATAQGDDVEKITEELAKQAEGVTENKNENVTENEKSKAPLGIQPGSERLSLSGAVCGSQIGLFYKYCKHTISKL